MPTRRCCTCKAEKPVAEFVNYGTGPRCKSCKNQTAAKWREGHREAARAWSKAHYHANKAASNAVSAAYRQTHQERIREVSKAYSAGNKHLLAEKNRAWYVKNREYAKAAAKQWRLDNPERVRITLNALRIKRNKAEGSHTVSDIRALREKQNGLCPGCGADLGSGYHIDHIMPLSKGGTDWPDNLQLLCRDCNRKKGRKLPEEWAALLLSSK